MTETMTETTTDPDRDLLDVLMAPFRAHAVHAAAALDLPERLTRGPVGPDPLAHELELDPGALRRLLRLLAALRVVEGDDRNGYRTGPLGELLHAGHDRSMRALALCYAEQFYAPMRHVVDSLRSGDQSFARVFGAPLFEHYARDPAAGRLFDDAMAAGSTFFRAVPAAFDLTGNQHVVDVGGGDGSLLGAVLAAHPGSTGALAEVPRMRDTARDRLAALGVLDRCDVTACDMFDAVPASGDVYLLSRVLHDWDDRRCHDILRAVRAAMPGDATLLVIERVVPEHGEPSLALEFDLHMLVNTGGAERTFDEFGRLFERAGFRHTRTVELPLDVRLLTAVPTPCGGPQPCAS